MRYAEPKATAGYRPAEELAADMIQHPERYRGLLGERQVNDKKALIALMDLVLALADYVTTPPGHRSKATERVQERATRLRALGALCEDGQAARTAVAATERRYDRMWGLEPIEADDNRLTQPFSLTHEARLARDPEYAAAWATECAAELDKRPSRRGHKRYGGKPGCGCSVCQCARSVGG